MSLAGRHLLANADQQILVVPVEGPEAQIVLNLDGPAQVSLPVGVDDLACRGAEDIDAPPGGDVDAIVQGAVPLGHRVEAHAVWGGDVQEPLHRGQLGGGIVDEQLLLDGRRIGALVGVQVRHAILHDLAKLPQAGQAGVHLGLQGPDLEAGVNGVPTAGAAAGERWWWRRGPRCPDCPSGGSGSDWRRGRRRPRSAGRPWHRPTRRRVLPAWRRLDGVSPWAPGVAGRCTVTVARGRSGGAGRAAARRSRPTKWRTSATRRSMELTSSLRREVSAARLRTCSS